MDAYKGCECDWANVTIDRPTLIDEVSDVVVALTNGRVTGRCTHTVRPCNTYGYDCWDSYGNYDCCDTAGIPIDGIDVAVTEVKLGAEVLVAGTDYFILDGYKLVKREGSWPSGQDIRRPMGEPGTFSITYTSGFLPFVAQMAATELACVITRWVSGRISLLPPGVQSANVDGALVSVDPSQVTAQHTPWINQLIALYGGARGEVYSPELNDGWRLHTTSA